MLHTVLSVLRLRDERIQLVQVGSHLLVQIDLPRINAAVGGIVVHITKSTIRRLHCHQLVGWRLSFLLAEIRLFGFALRRPSTRAYLHFEQ